MIAQYDIRLLKHWLHLARTIGTDAIKITVGDKLDTYRVTLQQTGTKCIEKSKKGGG